MWTLDYDFGLWTLILDFESPKSNVEVHFQSPKSIIKVQIPLAKSKVHYQGPRCENTHKLIIGNVTFLMSKKHWVAGSKIFGLWTLDFRFFLTVDFEN